MSPRELKDLAWLGDAVLALYARQWLLREPDSPPYTRQEKFIRFTSNDFLQSAGEPTRVEAEIGAVYSGEGLEAAFAHIEATLVPRFRKHLSKRSRGFRGSKG